MGLSNKQVHLVSRPVGEATRDNFAVVESPVRALEEGEILVRNQVLSLDPYMRGRMNDHRSYAAPQSLHTTMLGGTVGEVLESRHERYVPGDKVVCAGGWQTYSVLDPAQPGAVRRLHAPRFPLSAYLGVVGMPGVTAWYGVHRLLEPRGGDTLLVSAASGAVGSVVGQLGKALGAKVVGIAGGEEKCRYVCNDLGFDGCLDHRQYPDAKSLAKALGELCPEGISCNFENVGGKVLEAALARSRVFGRVAICGLAAGYNGEDVAVRTPQWLLVQRLRVQGFIVTDHPEVWPTALAELENLVAEGKIRYRESFVDGLEQAPEAFLGMLKGHNFGKQLVRV